MVRQNKGQTKLRAPKQRAAASRRAKKLHAPLTELVRAELVRALQEAGNSTVSTYVFKHALVQDTAYQSLLKNERKRLHRAIGFTLEREYGDRADEFAADLALHFGEAGDDEKTFGYAELAGDRAARIFAYPEAHAQYARALDALERVTDTAEYRRARVDLIVKLVAVSLRARGPEWSLERLRAAEKLLDGLHTDEDRVRRARVHFWMGDAFSHLNQQRQAIEYLQEVLDTARAGIADETLLAIPANVIGRALVAQGQFRQAQPLLAQAAPLLEKSANWYEWVLAVGFLGFALAAQGDTDAGLQETVRARTRAQELGTPIGIADSHIFSSFIYMQRDEYAQAAADASAALRAATGLDDRLLIFLAHNAGAWAQVRLAHYDEAEHEFIQAQKAASEAGGQLFFADMFLAAYADLALRQGRLDQAIARAQHAIEVARAVGSVFSEGLAQRVWGQALAAAHPSEARAHLETGLALFESGNAQIEAARTRRALQELAGLE